MPTSSSPVSVADPTSNRNFQDLHRALNDLSQRFFWGTGTPEGNVAAPVGCIYLRLDGGVNTTGYAKTSGPGNTGWTAFV